MMFQAPKSVPDRLTYARIVLVPVLWLLAVAGQDEALGVGFLVAGLTDVLDGYLARRSGQTTRLGSQLDSVADMLLIVSVVLWLILLRPVFIREQLPLIGLWAVLGAASILLGWLKFRRFANLHLYSAKVAGVLGYLFAAYLLITSHYSRLFFYLTIGTCILAALEALLVQILRRRVDEHAGWLFHRSRT